ncbi:IS30 family transposase, partial [Enterococcus faecium]|nr:IS30 family transposase [Enterococcus faecium]MDT2326666.1 IS30 family transposase [Enterococcus faecium]
MAQFFLIICHIRGRQTIYNVYNFLKCGGTALEYFEQ